MSIAVRSTLLIVFLAVYKPVLGAHFVEFPTVLGGRLVQYKNDTVPGFVVDVESATHSHNPSKIKLISVE